MTDAGRVTTTDDGAGGRYTHGHAESVLRSHRWRTAANSAAHLLPHLRPGLDHITVAYGRDFADVSPVSGMIVGGGEHTVQVAVSVEPA